MSELRPRLSPLMLQLIDVATAAALFFVVFDAITSTLPPEEPDAVNMIALAAAAMTLPVAARRRWPLSTWVFVSLGQLYAHNVSLNLGDNSPPAVASFAYLLCLYTVGVRYGRMTAIAVGVVATTWTFGIFALAGGFLLTLLTPLAVVVGQFAQARLRALDRLEAQAEQTLAAQAVADERLRIARELHDVVAHHMSAIAIRSEVVRLQADGDASRLSAGLADVRATSLAALSEMRQIVATLREAPAPGLERLDDLVETARATGLTVSVTRTSDPVPADVGATAYRIVQESLSNAMRHAPGSAVTVSVSAPAPLSAHGPAPAPLSTHGPVHGTGSALIVEVRNQPPPAPPAPVPPGPALPALPAPSPLTLGPEGHGLRGMRERATLLGGSIEAGPTPEGGFAVTAVLPIF